MHKLSFGLLGLIVLMLIVATVVEKIYGSAFAYTGIYTAPVTILLWAIMLLSAIRLLLKRRTWKHTATFALHLSFVLILIGALTTHLSGVQGKIHLRENESASKEFFLSDGARKKLPFSVGLKSFSQENYTGTAAPMDYISIISIVDRGNSIEGTVSMNNIFKYKGFRFYQSGFDADGKGTTLSVAFDPWGIGITYAGYICLLLSMIGFFFSKDSHFRTLLQKAKKAALILPLLVFPSIGHAQTDSGYPKTVSSEAAEAFGNLHVYYNDRICPMQTLARDFTIKLYGKATYKGLTAEQVLAGWFFYYDSWKNEPMIKIKGTEVRETLGISGKYAALTDFIYADGYKLDALLANREAKELKNVYAANEKFNLISMVCTGRMFRIYPYGGDWYSLADKLPGDMPYEEWAFVTGSMNYVAEKVAMNDDVQVTELLGKIRQYQLKKSPDGMPSKQIFTAEKLYNSSNWNKPIAMLCICLGLLSFLIFLRRRAFSVPIRKSINAVAIAVFAYLSFHIAMRWYVSGHIPLSNGFETMQFLAWCSLPMGFVTCKRFPLAQPFALLLCGFALLVAMMGESNPQITRLMPVLHSPLLSIHVMVIMISYALFAFMMLSGVTAVTLNYTSKQSREAIDKEVEYLRTISNIMLYPATFLLAAGIFIGAVWANVSWGRYWGWDPKEVWALITMLVYSFALHGKSLKWFRKPLNFHIFCIAAFLCVLITYFGVNFILGGMHSYA